MGDVFREEATSDTPLFIIDRGANLISITGVSMPENSFEFFDPLERKVLDTFANHTGDLALEIELSYLNSMTSKQLLKLIKLLSVRHPSLKVTWKHIHDDDIIRMKGEEIKEITPNVNVDIVSVN